MSRKKMMLFTVLLLAAFGLAACSNGGMDHSKMEHSSSSEVPEGLKEAKNPAYPLGSKTVVKTDHMEGMNGSEAIITGAYDTTVYAVTYTPKGGGEKVANHKWIIHEEIENAREVPFKKGEEVTLMAHHMKGMMGAKATIDSAEKTTVYMIDYSPANGGKEVKNHKWVTESELSALIKSE